MMLRKLLSNRIKNKLNVIRKLRKTTSGYSLVELSITTSIAAMLAVGGLAIIQKKQASDKEKITKKRLEQIEKTLNSFSRVHGYLPCPASPSTTESNSLFGKSQFNSSTQTCTGTDVTNGVVGMVPVRTIGLSDENAYDGWERKFTYRIATNAAIKDKFSNPGFKGDIRVIDINNNEKTRLYSSGEGYGAAYIIISHGANGGDYNAAWRKNYDYTADGASTYKQSSTSLSGKERFNSDHSVNTYVQNEISNTFDDIVLFNIKQNFIKPKNYEAPFAIDEYTCHNANLLASHSEGFESFAATSSANQSLADHIQTTATIVAELCKNPPPVPTACQAANIPCSGIKQWLDAAAGHTMLSSSDCSTTTLANTNGTIGCWKDVSGNSNHVSQTTETSRPTLTFLGINNNKGITFDGDNDHLKNTSSIPLTADDDEYTIAAIWRTTTASNTQVIWEQNSSSVLTGRRGALLLLSSGTYGFNGQGNDAHTITSYNANVAYASVMVVNGVNIKLFTNGNSETGTVPNEGNMNLATDVVLVGSKVNASEYFSGILAEIIVYDRALSDDEAEQVNTYLQNKWLSTAGSVN